MQKYAAPATKSGSASKAFGAVRMIMGFLVSKKTIPLFVIIMLISVLGSIHESVKQKSFAPVIIDV